MLGQKLQLFKKNFLFQQQTGRILNHLTLRISNDEVLQNYNHHQAQKFDRILWFAIPGTFAFFISDLLNKDARLVWLQHLIVLLIFIVYIVIRRTFKNTYRIHEIVIFVTYTVLIISCTLINT